MSNKVYLVVWCNIKDGYVIHGAFHKVEDAQNLLDDYIATSSAEREYYHLDEIEVS